MHTSEAVVAQVWRDGSRQARLAAVLNGVTIHPLVDGRGVGSLLARSGGSDVVDAHVVVLGAALTQGILTGDPDDLVAIATCLGPSKPDILAWGYPPLRHGSVRHDHPS